ncbi:MAG: M20/M25/M40 family metallo-hydrolase [Gemmatimonadota bacterium]
MIDPLELTRQLVAIPSPTGSEGAAIEHLAQALAALGYRVTRQPVTPGRDNIYAWREPPIVVFSTHIDCVPPFVPLREDAEALHGRGTCDAKGLAAAMVAAAEQLNQAGERRIGLLFVVGEENGSDGAMAAAALEPKGRFLINGEPTENVLTIGQKGALRVDLHATGRAAHSAYPDEGSSAIAPLLDTIRRIQALDFPSDELLGETTLNIGLIEGGVAPNVIAPSATAQLLIRTVVPTGPLRALIAAAAAPGVTVDFAVEIPPYKGTAPAGWRTTVVSFASDVPFHERWGERFQMGPGSIRVAHTDHERLDKREMREGIDLYVTLARDLIARTA